MSDITIEAMEYQLARQKEHIERSDAAHRLAKNRDFKKLILEEFCTTECARYVQESGDPLLEDRQRADALAMAQASGHLRRYLSLIHQFGVAASNQVPQIEEAIEEMRHEGED